MVLELEDSNGKVYTTWAPAHLVARLTDDKDINFVLNEGLKQSESDPSKTYFAFSKVRFGQGWAVSWARARR